MLLSDLSCGHDAPVDFDAQLAPQLLADVLLA
jgi:hypothetical protein